MKLTESESKDNAIVQETEKQLYPWGLRIELNDDSMKKLGLEKIPSINSKLKLEAIVEIIRVDSSDSVDGGKKESMSLQITDMALNSSQDKKESDPLKKFYSTDGTPAIERKKSGTLLVEM